MRGRRYLASAVAAAVLAPAAGCSDAGVKGVGWGGGVQIFAKAATIDTSTLSRVVVCVEKACADVPRQDIGARSSTPKPFGFQFGPEDVQDRNGVPLSGKELRVQVTLKTTANTVIAAGSASSELRYVSPEGWYCKEELAQRISFAAGPVVAVEFQSASRLVGLEVRVPKPSRPSPVT